MTTSVSKSIKFDSLEQQVYLNLWRTYDRLRSLEDQLFEQFEISSQQYNVLRLLDAARPEQVPTLKIASRLISRAPDITRMLDRLEDRKLLERVRAEGDRRLILAQITPEGRKLLKKISKPLEECHRQQLGHLSSSQMKQLCQLLQAARRPHEPEGGLWNSDSVRDSAQREG